jgi:hypothetical protein
MIVAAGLALALTASTGQEASAWSKFNFNVGLNLSYESTGSCFQWGGWTCLPNPPPCGAGYCPAPVMPAFNGHAYGYPQQAAPVAPAAAAAQARTQQVGYYFYGQGYAPSYWYGN